MELIAVLKARALAMIELDSLNLGGRIRLSDCIQPLLERYDFQVFPTKPEHFDLSDKGARFESGRADGLLIDSLVIYDGAIYVDTLSSTDESERILREMLEWGRNALGLTYDEKKIRRWGFISDVVFQTTFPLLASVSHPLARLAEKTSEFTEQIWDGIKYTPKEIKIGHDPTARQHGIANFVIAHRVNTTHAENVYFSEAPLPTHLHLKFLEEFEADVLRSLKQ